MRYLDFLVTAWLFYNWDFPFSAQQHRMYLEGIRDSRMHDHTLMMMSVPDAYDIFNAPDPETCERLNQLLHLITVLPPNIHGEVDFEANRDQGEF